MRKFLRILCSVILALCAGLCLASCGGGGPTNSNGSSGGNGEQEMPLPPEVEFENESGRIEIKNGGGYKVVVLLDGKEYAVNGSTFIVANYITHSGEYPFTVVFYKGGEWVTEQNFTYIREHKKEEDGGEEKEWVEVAFSSLEGNLIKRIVVERGYTLQESDYPALPTAVGVTYSWDTDFGEAVDGNLEIRVKATYQEYTITYHANGGELTGEYPTVYTVKESVTLPTPVREGYLFGGWYESAGFTGNLLSVVGGAGNTGDKSLYAKWSEITPEAQECLDALNESAAKTAVTSVADGFESAVDLSGATPYRHLKSKDKISFVLTGGYYYDYEDKSYYAYEESVDIFMALPFEGVLGNLVEIHPEGGGEEKSFLVKLKGDSAAELRIKVKDGLVVYMGTKDGKEYYDISYSVTKITPNEAEFEKKKKVVIEVYRDGVSEQTYEYLVAENKTLADFPEIMDLINSAQDLWVKGFFLDKEFTKPVTNTNEIVSRVYFSCYTHWYLIENAPITLRHTCACNECEGKVTDYQITLKEWLEMVQGWKGTVALDASHEELLLRGFAVRVFDGYLLEGPFTAMRLGDKEWIDKEGEMKFPFGYNEAQEAFTKAVQEGKHENFVLEIFTVKRTVKTATITVHMGSEVLTRYLLAENGVDVSDDFLYDYIPKGKVYYGWYADEELQNRLPNYLGNTDLREFYAKVTEDDRKEITVHLGVKKGGVQFQDRYHAQGQTHLYEEEYFGASQKVKFFTDEPILTTLRMMSIAYMGNMGEKSVAGFYLDEAFTMPVTEEMTAETIDEVFVRWGKQVNYKIHFLTGDIQEGMAVEGTPIAEILEEGHMLSVVDGHRNFGKFYADGERTKEIVSVIEGDIFVGIEPLPTITIVCVEGCQAVHSARATANYLEEGWFYEGNLFGRHGLPIGETGMFNECEIYFDKACTQNIKELKEQYYLATDLTLYAKPIYTKMDLTVHCDCLAHGEDGFSASVYMAEDLNELVDENCDFGRYQERKEWFANEERTKPAEIGKTEVGEVWLNKPVKVRVQVYGEQAFDIIVNNVEDALWFYCEKPSEYDDPDKMPSARKDYIYGLYTDDTYSKVRILPTDYSLTAGETFYFKEMEEGEAFITVVSEEYGERQLTIWQGVLHYSTCQVDKALFTDYGKKVEGYYYDQELTVLAMQVDKNYYINQSITLYAKLVEMPKAVIHYNHYGYTDSDGTTYDLVNDERFENLLWRQFHFGQNYPFEEGYVFELCENEDGTGVVNLNAFATAGDYYFVKNEYSKNNVKITLLGVENEGEIKNGWVTVGKENYFYMKKGGGLQAVLAGLQGAYSAGVSLPNGQKFSLSSMVEFFGDDGGENTYIPSALLKIYTDEAKTKELSTTAVLNGDTTLWIALNMEKMKEHTVYLEDKGTFVFYTCEEHLAMSDGAMHELMSYLRKPSEEWVNENLVFNYPDLFKYGAISATYFDAEMTKPISEFFEDLPEKIYARLREFYFARVILENGNTLISYTAFKKKSLNDLLPEFMDNLQGYGAFKPGHIPYLAADKEGTKEVAFSEGLNGIYYICYRRDTAQAEITVGGYDCTCGTGAHEGDFWDWSNKDLNAGGDGMGVLLGTYERFYLAKGASLQIFVDQVKEMHGEWKDDVIIFPTVKLYEDAEMTKEITDLTVTADKTVFVKVVWD